MNLALGLAIGALAASASFAAPRFEDRSAALTGDHAYVGGWEHFVGGGVAVLDCNSDGRPDIFAAGGTAPARLWVNATGAPGAPLAFESTGLMPLTGATGAYPLDVDGDGNLDLAVLRVGPNRLLRGDGACGFADATDDWGLQATDRWTTAFSATWEPGENWPTLAFGNYVDRTAADGPFGACDDNELHRPVGHGYAMAVGLSPGYCALSMLFSDWQRKGRAELRVSNDRHYYLRGGQEQMWRMEPLRLRTAAEGWEPVSIWGMGIASADVDGNGLPDVMLTSMGDQLLMMNHAQGLVRAPYDIGTYAQRPHVGDDGRPSTGWHAQFGDIDNDGRRDLFIAKGNVDQMPGNAIHDPNNLLIQGADGRFREAGAKAGVASTARARGAALADFDGDGRLDILVANRRAPLELYQNSSPATGNWIAIALRGRDGNTQGVGAWVTVRSGGREQITEVTVGGGHASGQAGALHFGLGTAETAEIRVRWPDGTLSDWRPLAANRRHLIRHQDDS